MFEASIKQTDPMEVAYMPMHGPYAQIPDGLGRLYGWVAQHGLQPSGMPEALYFNSPQTTPEVDVAWELWAPIAGDAPDAIPDASGVGLKHVGTELVAAAMHKGPYEEITPTYEALTQWILGQGCEIAGPAEEVYLSDPATVRPEDYLTEVRFPVVKR